MDQCLGGGGGHYYYFHYFKYCFFLTELPLKWQKNRIISKKNTLFDGLKEHERFTKQQDAKEKKLYPPSFLFFLFPLQQFES